MCEVDLHQVALCLAYKQLALKVKTITVNTDIAWQYSNVIDNEIIK